MPPAIAAKRLVKTELANAGAMDLAQRIGRGRHLQPGLVAYDNEDGSKTVFLLDWDGIAALRPTAKGKPIVGSAGAFDHMKVNAQDQAAGKYDGAAIESYQGPDGWESILFQLKDRATAEACERGYQFSCAYIPETDGQPGTWHNMPYDEKIIGGEYTHFAVVPNPRYEGATIELLNSKGGIMKNALKAVLVATLGLKGLKELVNAAEADEAGKLEALKKDKEAKKAEAQNAYNAAMGAAKTEEEKAAAKAAFEKANADIDAMSATAAEPVVEPPGVPAAPLGGGDVVADPGIPQGQVEAAGAAGAPSPTLAPAGAGVSSGHGTLTPQQAQEAEKAAADKAALEKKNAEEAAKKAKAEEERLNAIRKKAAEEAKKDAERRERFNSLRRLAEERGAGPVGAPVITVVSAQEKEDLGRDRYGSRR